MSRIAPPAEKVEAVMGIYVYLMDRLETRCATFDPRVQAQLLATATTIAMYTDTRNMGLLSFRPTKAERDAVPKYDPPDPLTVHEYDEDDPYARE